MAGNIINQERSHGGARTGAGRPKGARDRRTVASHADVAAVIARVELEQLVRLSPVDVLRLAMLLAMRRGDLEAATAHARRLVLAWQPWMGVVAGPGVRGGSQGAGIVNRLVRELHGAPGGDPAKEPQGEELPVACGVSRKHGSGGLRLEVVETDADDLDSLLEGYDPADVRELLAAWRAEPEAF